jgi:IS5 family transposase
MEEAAMERKPAQPTFVDAVTRELGGPRSAAFFERCEQAIPWQRLADAVADLYPNDGRRAGRPHWPLVLMVKCVLVQKWFGLSDPQLEEVLRDRLSFRRFVGLSLNDATPDETTFVVFRRRLRESGHAQTLFETTLQCLQEQNLVVQEGTLVDATIIEAPLGGRRADGSSTRDRLASKTFKHGRTYHGYKAHVTTDKRGLIKSYVFDTASSSDHTYADELMADEQTAVYADSGFRSKKRAAALEARGVFCGIAYGLVKGQKALTAEQQAHNRVVTPIRAFVEHPFAWLRKMNFWRTRYRGMCRNGLDFALRAIAYNWKRSFSLTPVVT